MKLWEAVVAFRFYNEDGKEIRTKREAVQFWDRDVAADCPHSKALATALLNTDHEDADHWEVIQLGEATPTICQYIERISEDNHPPLIGE